MRVRCHLRSPGGPTVVREVVAGRWVEPTDSPSEVIGEGLWALPGLVDAHAHLASSSMEFGPGDSAGAVQRAVLALSAGVMLIIDKGWGDTTVVKMIDSVPADSRPDIEAAGKIITTSDGYYPGFADEIDPNEIEAVVSASAHGSKGWVKLVGDWPRRGVGPVSNFDQAQLTQAVTAAHTANSRVAIHTMARETPSMAVAAGVDSIEHGLFLTRDDVGALGERGGTWVPTVLRTEAIVEQLGAESSGGRLLVEGLANIAPLLPEAFEAGVHVLTGTDLVGAPAEVAREALRLAEFGLSNSQVLSAVSTAGFDSTGRTSGFDIGSPADAVFFESNPLEELGSLTRPKVVMRLGQIK